MKIKKSLSVIFLLTVITLVGMQGCKKYPENNDIDLSSSKDRVSQTWKVENYKVDSVDLTSILAGYTETYTNLGIYSYKWGLIEGIGTWEFRNNEKEILIKGTNNLNDKTLYIQKLENNQFWYYYMDGAQRKEFHLVHN